MTVINYISTNSKWKIFGKLAYILLAYEFLLGSVLRAKLIS